MAEDSHEKKELAQAQKLIKAGKYDEARRILITLEHPTAEKWLRRINEIAVETPVNPSEKKRSGCLRNIGIAVLALFACLIILNIANPDRNQTVNPEGNTSPNIESEAGNRSNPHPSGTIQNVIDGRFRVNAIRYNMSATVEEMNIFNIDPEANESWILVNATFHCDLSPDEACNTRAMRFELVGNAGQAYNHRAVAILDNPFAGEIFGGSSITGDIGFIVNRNDSNFLFAVVQFGQRIFFDFP